MHDEALEPRAYAKLHAERYGWQEQQERALSRQQVADEWKGIAETRGELLADAWKEAEANRLEAHREVEEALRVSAAVIVLVAIVAGAVVHALGG